MSVMSNIVINDGQATPVSHTFTPQRITADDVASWLERTSGALNAQPEITMQLRSVKASSLNKVSIRLSIPKVVSVSDLVTGLPVTRVVNTPLFSGTFTLPWDSTEQERKNLRVLVSNLLMQSAVLACIDKGEAPIGG